MNTIKIISNPYRKTILFQRMNESSEWVDIDFNNNPNSRLLNKDLAGGFFPFKAKEIIDVILEEYSVPDEHLTIEFEGSADEFFELEDACGYVKNEVGSKLSVQRSEACLENARDILPEVKKLFQEMNSLIMQSVSKEEIQHDLSRFEDASSDVVPICVLGNYSAGKSTFINALIGSEILPSGVEPVTAKVYKIYRSQYQDRAKITYQYHDKDMCIIFTERENQIKCESEEKYLPDKLKEALSEAGDKSIAIRVNVALSIINEYEEHTDDIQISDLIEVEVPFTNGVLYKTPHPFVIFDTPGSNSASNAKHLMVLKDAMANMTNGLPIFLSTPDALDSTDNENLYQIIRSFEELDDRFTMIVVNKADSAGIQRRSSEENEQKRILSQAVPRNLYSGGLFYVSSIMGLGAKTHGSFEDYVYEDVYDAQERRYSNPEDKHYRTLYVYNIMPDQIKHRSDELAKSQVDLIYANSGLFSVETEIETFAGKYAAYNKCFQSQLFLRKIIQFTEDEIESQKDSREELRQSIHDKLESDKKQLIEHLETTAIGERDRFDTEYEGYMSEYISMAEGTFSSEALKEQNAVFISEQESKQDYEDREKDVREARESITENLKTNMGQVFKDRKFNFSAIRSAAGDFTSDFGAVVERSKKRQETRHEVDRAAADDLLHYVKTTYESKLAEFHDLIETQSKNYWKDNTESIRRLLIREVSGSDVLTNDRRTELEQIIISYEKISFDENVAEQIFRKGEFERRLRIGNKVLWESDHLDTIKLAKTYNEHMEEDVATRYNSIEESHRVSAHNWIRSLLDEINTNIVDYSPELSKQAKQIQEITREIDGLIGRKFKLKAYTEQLRAMMDWKISEV